LDEASFVGAAGQPGFVFDGQGGPAEALSCLFVSRPAEGIDECFAGIETVVVGEGGVLGYPQGGVGSGR
jgi:hypothetical protein